MGQSSLIHILTFFKKSPNLTVCSVFFSCCYFLRVQWSHIKWKLWQLYHRMEGWVETIDLLISLWRYKEALTGDGTPSPLPTPIISGAITAALLSFHHITAVSDLLLVNRGLQLADLWSNISIAIHIVYVSSSHLMPSKQIVCIQDSAIDKLG